MASCLITTAGTNGTLRINYNLSGDPVTAYHNFGDTIYIEDTATDITYTTLTGDVTAASGCVTITNLPENCYMFSYDRLKNDSSTYISNFTQFILGVTTYTLTSPASDKLSGIGDLINEINLIGNNIMASAIKITALTDNYYQIDLVVKVTGTDIPELKIESPNGNLTYIVGVSSLCVPIGFYELQYCPVPPAP